MIQKPERDYLPARMINEFVYCPRLFYYEHVEGVFVHNRDTLDGARIHLRVDAKEDQFPTPVELASLENMNSQKSRSVTMASENYGIVAKLDLIEFTGNQVVPVDYKRGRPQLRDDGSVGSWDADRVQVVLQALILIENGYDCREAMIYYAETKQRVRITIDEAAKAEAVRAIEGARYLAEQGTIPPPLSSSPKCPRCSLVGICLPDETKACSVEDTNGRVRQLTLFEIEPEKQASFADQHKQNNNVRRLVPARDDKRPLYLNTQGLTVGKSGAVLQIRERARLVDEVRINDICQLNVMGNIQVSTQAIQTLCENDIPICWFSMGGWFYGVTEGLGIKNIFLRKEQFRHAEIPLFCLKFARAIVAGKIRNQRVLLQRNHIEPPSHSLSLLKQFEQAAMRAEAADELLGIEGTAARIYFENFQGMIKVGEDALFELIAAPPVKATAKKKGKKSGSAQPSLFEQTLEQGAELFGGKEPGSSLTLIDGTNGNNGNVTADFGGNSESRNGKGVESPFGQQFGVGGGNQSGDGLGDRIGDGIGEDIEQYEVLGKAEGTPPEMTFDFKCRNRRPPKDPVNALLSLAYSLLAKDLTVIARTIGFDQYLGFFHQPRFGRASLALDLMEPFRPLIADSAVLSAINMRMVTPKDFVKVGDAVSLTKEGRKNFFRAYEQRMDTLVTHPMFGYRVNYRRIMEIQTRLLARVLTGELNDYPVFTTR